MAKKKIKKDVLRFKRKVEKELKEKFGNKALTNKETKPLTNEEFAKAVQKIVGLVKPDKNFKPQAYYNQDGDLIEVYWENVDYYGEWLNHGLTLYKAQDDNRVIGCEINWIESLIEKNK